ncbi:MAG: polysaccharide biosynthesis C-terminal domain-containing protein [Caulobacterales bacterium]
MIANRLLTQAPLQIVQAFIGFATLWAFTRLMTPADYGAYTLLVSVSMLAHTVAFTWAEAAAFRYSTTDDANAKLKSLAALRTVAITGAAIVAFIALLGFWVSGKYGAAIAFTAAAAYLRFLTRLARETERASQQTSRYVINELNITIDRFGIGVFLLRFTQLGVAAPFAGLAIASAILAMRDTPRLLAPAKGAATDLETIMSFARYGVPLAATLALDLGVQTATRLILAITHGETAAGVYAAAYGLARPLDLLCIWIGLSAGPVLLEAFRARRMDRVRAISQNAFLSLVAIAIPAAAGLALVAAPLSEAMIGAGLRDAVSQTLPWLALAGLCNGVALHIFSESFQLTEKTLWRAALLICAAILQLTLTCILTPLYGPQGAAIAAAAGAAMTLALFAISSFRLIGFTPEFSSLAKIACATAAMAYAVMLAPQSGGIGELIVKSAIGACVYALVAFVLDIGAARTKCAALLPAAFRLTQSKA